MFDKWQSLLNHLVSQHTDHSNSLFSSSLHSIEYNTDNKDWFEPGTDYYEGVCKILQYQIGKGYKKGMQSRLHIAAMHYNENCGEETDDTDEEGNV
ncbi:hypothetical protein BgiMline_018586 [Biomphalaria glabrata]|nr:hypothetical protein BgiMline_006203 [Biomphalaria glabrata]